MSEGCLGAVKAEASAREGVCLDGCHLREEASPSGELQAFPSTSERRQGRAPSHSSAPGMSGPLPPNPHPGTALSDTHSSHWTLDSTSPKLAL